MAYNVPYDKVRTAIEQMYDGICTIYITKNEFDKTLHETVQKLELVVEDQECRVAYKTAPVADGVNAAKVKQIIKLFIAPEIQIPPGSIIEVVQNNVVEKFRQSGIPAVYVTHQEILLEVEGYT